MTVPRISASARQVHRILMSGFDEMASLRLGCIAALEERDHDRLTQYLLRSAYLAGEMLAVIADSKPIKISLKEKKPPLQFPRVAASQRE